MTVRLRSGHPADAPSLGAVERAAAARFRDIGLDAIAEGRPTAAEEYRALAEAGLLWVAEPDDGAPVGLAIAGSVDGEGYLAEVSVHPGHGRQGLGRALIGRVEAWALERRFRRLFLTTFRDVPWNRPYYERLGFAAIDEDRVGPDLQALRAGERARGLDGISPRLCMVKALRRCGAAP